VPTREQVQAWRKALDDCAAKPDCQARVACMAAIAPPGAGRKKP
jgi:hypothetical protein